MDPFLKQVAAHYCKEDVSSLCFIFPSRRALAFFKKIFAEEYASLNASKPVMCPRMYTINDFFFHIAGKKAADRVTLLLELYESYKRFYSIPGREVESLDDFIFWGDILLGDFNDVDKYLVDPKRVFTNVSDFKEIQDDFEYLEQPQIEAIRKFVANFRKDGRLTVDLKTSDPGVKARFLHIWDILYKIYEDFSDRLDSQGLAYEGQVYRRTADEFRAKSAVDILGECFRGTGKFIFAGLNALNECEKLVLAKMRDAALAEFCWDYASPWIKDRRNRSSFFMSKNLEQFPQAFDIYAEARMPEFNVVSIASSIGQAKQLPQILERTGGQGIETAVILPDETLLIPVLNSIPPSIEKLNVTMGFPMSGSCLHTLMGSIASLQMHIRERDGVCYFYHKQVRDILSNGIMTACMDEQDKNVTSAALSDPRYYLQAEKLQGTPLLDAIFKVIIKDTTKASVELVHRMEDYQCGIISTLAPRLKASEGMATELEFAKEYYMAVARMRRRDMPILPSTYLNLLAKMVGSISVPFHGEPLKGLQIMGPLETRALDFENLIILSCNEGIFPRKSVSSSFIPHELRKGFGLPTYEHQDAMWAYYFYRMIQRAKRVWMLSDARPDSLKGGEESRYIKQLEKYCNVPLKRFTATAGIANIASEQDIPKSEQDITSLRAGRLSASALKDYIDCPAKFYYSTVRKLKETDEVSESLDGRTVGNVFHKVMQRLYGIREKVITRPYLESLQKDKDRIRDLVDETIMKELKTFEVTGRNLIYSRMVVRYVQDAIKVDLDMMDSYGVRDFRILSLEKEEKGDLFGFPMKGFLDRKDSFRPSEIRVVDYKTGSVSDDEKTITDENARKVVDALFGDKSKGRPKIALQMYIYDKFVLQEYPDAELINAVYTTSELSSKGVNKKPVSREFIRLMDERVERTLREIEDLSVPYKRASDHDACTYCNFKNICGR